jgi:predicted KAP-like P-loop ATPase
MEDNGVVCKNISRATFSESIAWNNYYCKDTSKCTSEIKKAVKRSFDFYMSEKGTNYDPHYRAIAHKLFETM